MAFQSAEGISVANAEIETLEVTDKVSGTLNIATGSPEAIAAADADDLVIGDGLLTNFGATIATNSSGQAKINFADGAGANAARGQIKYDHQFDKLSVSTAGAERAVVDEYGRVGIGTVSPPQRLTVQGGGVQIAGAISSPASGVSALLLDWVSSNSRYWSRGADATTQGTHNFYVLENDGGNQVNALEINASGLKLPVSGTGIDFSATGGGLGTVTSSLFDDYEEGAFTPVVADAASGGNTGSAATAAGEYTKVGQIVHFSLRLENIDTTGLTAGNTLYIRGLPYVAVNATPVPNCAVRTDRVSFADGIVGAVLSNTSATYLTSIRSGLSDLGVPVSDYVSGIADVYLSGSYIAA